MTQSPVEWAVSNNPIDYETAVSFMESRVRGIIENSTAELVWLLEHPPIYTAGTSAKSQDLLDENRFEVFETGRGGEFTYHGPGQRVAYIMLNVGKRGRDVRAFIEQLQNWVIETLDCYKISGEIRTDRVGVWVNRPDKGLDREEKIAAIGIRLKRWVSYHGISLNISPNLEHFTGITPCGIDHPNYGVTSLRDLGLSNSMHDVDQSLRKCFEKVFQSPTVDSEVVFPKVINASPRNHKH